jgi:Dolichyl-phosphate-mannose-protein mannosyltransferase
VNATSASAWRTRAPLLAVGLVALALGLFARFKNLGVASLATDEYYIVQSVRNVIRTGWPAFDCGGWYQRGLLLQYLSAGLQLLGVSETLAPRMIASLSSVVALPAVFAIGRRAYNPSVGLIAVSLLLVSIWEIEIARFGRMYMPFQAITAWYVLYFLRYTVDRNARALVPMVALTVVGILTWEGGVFLAAANFLPMFLLRDRVSFSPAVARKLVGLTLLVAFGYWLAVANLRVTSLDMLPENYTGETFDDVASGLFDLAPDYLPTIFSQPLWLALGVIPFAAGALALRNVVALRSRPLAALGLALAVVAAVCGQLAAVATILILLVVFRFVDWATLLGRSMRSFQLALVVCALFWLAFVAVTFHLHGIEAGGVVRSAALFGYQFARTPNFVNVALWPWARSVPILGLVMLIAIFAAIIQVTRKRAVEPLTAERALLAFVLCMLVAAAMSSPPRIETRYTFFLYPLVVVLGVGVLWGFVAAHMRRASVAHAVTTVSAFGVFAVTEDFDVDHLLHVDQPSVFARAGMSANLATHFVGHADDRALVRWLDANVVPGRDIVIAGYHVLDFYYANIAYFFFDYRDEVFAQSSCRRGTVERWTNKPLVYTVEALEAAVPARGRAFLVVFDDGGRLLSELAGVNAKIVLSQGGLRVIQVERIETARLAAR